MRRLKKNWGIVLPKLTWEICQNLTWALESLKIFHFNGLLLSKVYNDWAKKVQTSYLSWQWMVLQNLVRNWLVVSKLTWGIWQISSRALKSLKNVYFNALLMSKVHMFLVKKYKGVIFHNTEKWHRLFVSKLTWEIWKILTWVLESLKDFQFNELLLNKVYIAWDKKVQRSYLSWQRRVIKNAEGNWFVVSKLTWEICQILTWALGSLKIFTLTGSFWAKYILFEPEKCR